MASYDSKKAWTIAAGWFVVCIATAVVSGALGVVLASPPATPGQRGDPTWLAATLTVTAYVLFAYGYYWPKGTESRGRPLRPAWTLLFGLLWGISQGLLMLSIFLWLGRAGLTGAVLGIVMFIVYSAFAGLWQSRFWDIHVSPPHNIEAWNLRKVLVCHVPFLVLALIHLTVWGNAAIFVGWQVVALLLSSWVMHFPAPGDPGEICRETET